MLSNFASLYPRYCKLLTKPRTVMRALFVRYRRVAGLASASALALLLAGPAGWADDGGGHRGPVKLLSTIPVLPTPGNTTAGKLYSYDISWVDQATQTYYLADRSNKVVDVFDDTAGTLTQVAPTAPFAPFAGSEHGVNP